MHSLLWWRAGAAKAPAVSSGKTHLLLLKEARELAAWLVLGRLSLATQPDASDVAAMVKVKAISRDKRDFSTAAAAPGALNLAASYGVAQTL